MKVSAGLTIADRFCLVRKLGQGGMGSVWLAQHRGLDIPCAVKLISEDAARSRELRARFEREAKAAAQLRSPHVVQILDHIGVGLSDETSDPGERLSPPIAQLLDPRIDQLRGRVSSFSFRRADLCRFHCCCLSSVTPNPI